MIYRSLRRPAPLLLERISILAGPLVSCLVVSILCATATWQLWQLWQYQARQQQSLALLESSLQDTRLRNRALQEELSRSFDPEQIQPLLREKYGWIDTRDLLIKLSAPGSTTPAR